jgi:hypothetical protein
MRDCQRIRGQLHLCCRNPWSRDEFIKLVQDFGNREFQGVVVQSSKVLAQLLPGQRVGREIVFMPAMPAAIIVTRNVDIELAAKEVTASKFTDFSIRSGSAPGLVMVDEFVLDNFVAALEKEFENLRVILRFRSS